MIREDCVYTENANRAAYEGFITPDNLEPNPKNPIIASFFRNIGRADRLGSGVRNLFKYSRFYSGKDPEFREGDVFRIIVPLDENFSYDCELAGDIGMIADGGNSGIIDTDPDMVNDNPGTVGTNPGTVDAITVDTPDEEQLVRLLKANPQITQKQIQEKIILYPS